MQGVGVRLVAVLAEFMAASGLMLLVIGTMRENWSISVWGVAAAIGAAAAAVCATVMCAAGKVLRQQARNHMATEVEEFLRRER